MNLDQLTFLFLCASLGFSFLTIAYITCLVIGVIVEPYVRRALVRMTSNVQPRTIWDRQGATKYLSRYYLAGKPRMADGSSPFDQYGNPKPDAIWPKGWGLYLHRFHRSDADADTHSHPWKWAIALVLAGGYIEERLHKTTNEIRRRVLRPWNINFLTSDTFHRVTLLDGESWSLFLAGPKTLSWGFWIRESKTFVPWREYLARVQRPKEAA